MRGRLRGLWGPMGVLGNGSVGWVRGKGREGKGGKGDKGKKKFLMCYASAASPISMYPF